MSDLNILVSNGTCYTKAGDKLDASFIPCGNDAFGRQTCCGVGDNCLADNACFGYHGSGYGSQLTYLAGCTDPNYEDGSCPDKKGIDQPWIALTLCDNSDGVWGACSQEGNPSTLQPGSFCSCTDAAKFSPTAFKDANVLEDFASLPKATGDSINFQAGHTPTGTPTPNSPAESGSPTGGSSPSSTSLPGSSPLGSGGSSPTSGSSESGQASSSQGGSSVNSNSGPVTQTETVIGSATGSSASDSSSNTSSSSLNSGAKIGIGVGIAIAVLLLIAIITAVFLRRRKRRRAQTAAAATEVENGDTKDTPPLNIAIADAAGRVSDVTGTTTDTNGKPLPEADKPNVAELDSEAVMEVDGRTAHPWNRGSELDGIPVRPKTKSPVAELPGSLAGEQPPEWLVR